MIETTDPQAWPPLMLTVAPNGARKTKADHPALPITPMELANEALACRDAGAAMIHLHVRDADCRHSLDVGAYQAATDAVRDAVGDSMIIQVTSEATGIYTPEQQIDMVKKLRPEAVSLAMKEIIPDTAAERQAESFIHWMLKEKVHPQYILYSAEDVERFITLRERGVIPGDIISVLFVLGRYTAGLNSEPANLLPFLKAAEGQPWHWAVCAFGAKENAAVVAAACLGGHGRIGFENNLALSDGTIAKSNAALVDQAARAARVIGRPLASADTARTLHSRPATRIICA